MTGDSGWAFRSQQEVDQTTLSYEQMRDQDVARAGQTIAQAPEQYQKAKIAGQQEARAAQGQQFEQNLATQKEARAAQGQQFEQGMQAREQGLRERQAQFQEMLGRFGMRTQAEQQIMEQKRLQSQIAEANSNISLNEMHQEEIAQRVAAARQLNELGMQYQTVRGQKLQGDLLDIETKQRAQELKETQEEEQGKFSLKNALELMAKFWHLGGLPGDQTFRRWNPETKQIELGPKTDLEKLRDLFGGRLPQLPKGDKRIGELNSARHGLETALKYYGPDSKQAKAAQSKVDDLVNEIQLTGTPAGYLGVGGVGGGGDLSHAAVEKYMVNEFEMPTKPSPGGTQSASLGQRHWAVLYDWAVKHGIPVDQAREQFIDAIHRTASGFVSQGADPMEAVQRAAQLAIEEIAKEQPQAGNQPGGPQAIERAGGR